MNQHFFSDIGQLNPDQVREIALEQILETGSNRITAGLMPSITSLGLIGVSEELPYITYIEDVKYLDLLSKSFNSLVVICPTNLFDEVELLGKFGIAVDNPKQLFFETYNKIAGLRFKSKFPSVISSSANVHPDSKIAKYNVVIGKNSIIEAGVVIHERVSIGNDVIIRSNASIGASGFEHKRINNELLSVLHDGKVWISDLVEIGPNSVIGQGFWRNDTTLGTGTKLDNLVSVAHSSKIGEKVLIGAGTVISGSVFIEQNVYIGPGSTLTNSIHIGHDAKVVLGSVVYRDVPPNKTVMGSPAREIPIAQ